MSTSENVFVKMNTDVDQRETLDGDVSKKVAKFFYLENVLKVQEAVTARIKSK